MRTLAIQVLKISDSLLFNSIIAMNFDLESVAKSMVVIISKENPILILILLIMSN